MSTTPNLHPLYLNPPFHQPFPHLFYKKSTTPPLARKFNHMRNPFGGKSKFCKNFYPFARKHLGHIRFPTCAKIQRKRATPSNSRGTTLSPRSSAASTNESRATSDERRIRPPLLENSINRTTQTKPAVTFLAFLPRLLTSLLCLLPSVICRHEPQATSHEFTPLEKTNPISSNSKLIMPTCTNKPNLRTA